MSEQTLNEQENQFFEKILKDSSTGHTCLYILEHYKQCNIEKIGKELKKKDIWFQIATQDITCPTTIPNARVLKVENKNVPW